MNASYFPYQDKFNLGFNGSKDAKLSLIVSITAVHYL